jgi:hypothetical protein
MSGMLDDAILNLFKSLLAFLLAFLIVLLMG